MGFEISGTYVTSRQPNPKTFLDMTNAIMTANGIPSQASVTDAPSKHTIVASASINRALSRIWSAAQWDWRVVWVSLVLEDGVMFYPLPDDYEWFCTPPASIGKMYGMRHVTYEQLMAAYPDLQLANQSLKGVTGIIPNALITSGMEDRGYFGVPELWGVKGSEMFFFKVPAQEYYDSDMATDSEARFSMSYYGAYRDLTSDVDVIPVPSNLNDVVFFLANAYFKQAFEYPDFTADEQRGERMLNLAVNRNKLLHPEGTYSHFNTVLSPWGPYYGS